MNHRILKHLGLSLLLILPLAGCFQESKTPLDANIVRLKLQVEIPDFAETSTKSEFVDLPSCSRLFVIVFNEAGLRPSVSEATPSGQDFTVDLQPSALPRTLHFLALPADSPLINVLRDDIHGKSIDEATFASRLATPNGDAACWSRKSLPAGISSSTDLSGIKMVRNYAKVYILNATDNFQLESFRVYNASKYGMAVPFNGLNVGNTGDFHQNLFPIFFDGDGYMLDYTELNGTQGYRGFNHPSGQLRTPQTGDAGTYNSYLVSDGKGNDDPYDYIFETRYNPELGNNNAYILFKGKYSAEGNFGSVPSTWYKADFVYDPAPGSGGEWGPNKLISYDILRNYAYVLTIEGVIGEGHPTAEYAASQPARNNFDGSVAGIDISGVSDVASAMYISQTSIDLARTSGISHSTINLYYRNEHPRGTEANIPGTEVLITASGQSILNPSVVNSDGTLNLSAEGVVSERIASTDPSIADLHLKSGYWWHLGLPIIIDTEGVGTLQQTLSIKNKAGLTRHCVISIRPHFPFEIEGYSESPAIVAMSQDKPAGGDVIPVNFRIPDGMPANLFPLVFKVESYSNGEGPTGGTDVTRQIVQPNVAAIEAYKASLGPGDYQIEMPVAGNTYTIVGRDAADNADLDFRSYHYVRTLTWSEYNLTAADARSMKSFPVFLEPQYSPRDVEAVTALGTTTIWMRQGERDETFFSYKDDAGICTRRYAYEMRIVEPTHIVLPNGDDTFNEKPVYNVRVGSSRNLTVGVVSDRTGNPTPNALSLSKTANQISLTYTPAGTGLVTATVSVSAVTADRLPVTVVAGNVQDGVTTYGGSQDLFYIRTLKGERRVSFRTNEVTVLRNQTITSIYKGNLRVVEELEADCNTPITGNLIYSLSPDAIVRSNDYVEIAQEGGHYTVKGKTVNEDTPVKVYAIAEEDDSYERAVGELSLVVKQGVITQDGWWTDVIEGPSTGTVGVMVPITGSIIYDDYYTPTQRSFSTSEDLSFITADPGIATVQKIGADWHIIPRSINSDESRYLYGISLTMHVRGTDDNGDGVYGDLDNGDVFADADFVQTLYVYPGWWKVNQPSYVNEGPYLIYCDTNQNVMLPLEEATNFTGGYVMHAMQLNHSTDIYNNHYIPYTSQTYYLVFYLTYAGDADAPGNYFYIRSQPLVQNNNGAFVYDGSRYTQDNFSFLYDFNGWFFDGLRFNVNGQKSAEYQWVTYSSADPNSGIFRIFNRNNRLRNGSILFDRQDNHNWFCYYNPGDNYYYPDLYRYCETLDDVESLGYTLPAPTVTSNTTKAAPQSSPVKEVRLIRPTS